MKSKHTASLMALNVMSRLVVANGEAFLLTAELRIVEESMSSCLCRDYLTPRVPLLATCHRPPDRW